MPNSKKFDVFLSHHSADKTWVVKLKNALESRELSVWLDKDEIRPGDLFADALEKGLKASKNVVIVVSPGSMKSGWVKEEYNAALNLSKSKKQPLRLIPIILQTAKLPLFLKGRNWVDFTNEIEFSESVDKLINGITGQKEETNSKVEIPFVTVAMTLQQAHDVFNEKNSPNPSFTEFKQKLLDNIAIDYTKIYGKSPDNWKFPLDGQEEFSITVWKTLEDLNAKLQDGPGVPIVFKPRFETANFFSDDRTTYTESLIQLKRSGCVLVVDAISLFHPQIMKRLNAFHIEPGDNIAMVIISPIDTYSHPVMKMIESEARDNLELAFQKYAKDLDKQCEFEIGNIRSFKRWAFTALPDLADIIMKQKLKPSNREYIREKMGMPKGVYELIYGKRGAK